MFKTILVMSVTLVLAACGAEDKFDTGYSDGYASGYNTTCEIRSTLIEGDFGNPSYKQGYDAGYKKGTQDCRGQK